VNTQKCQHSRTDPFMARQGAVEAEVVSNQGAVASEPAVPAGTMARQGAVEAEVVSNQGAVASEPAVPAMPGGDPPSPVACAAAKAMADRSALPGGGK